MRQTMTQLDTHRDRISALSQSIKTASYTQPVTGNSASGEIRRICRLESISPKQSEKQTDYLLTVRFANKKCGQAQWSPTEKNLLLPELKSILYVETDPMYKVNGATVSDKSTRLLRYWQPIISDYSLAYLQTLFCKAPQPHALLRLLALINRLKDKRSKQLLTDLFGQIDIAKAFVTVPASYKHHHSMPGGLLIHSVECAEWLEKIAYDTLPKAEAELTIIAALLHDLGKIETMRHPDSGFLVTHEVLSLTLVEPFLCQMQSSWKQGANALRQMLSWPLNSLKFPKLPGLLLVKMADQYSTALSARNMAFAGQPDYFYWASLKTSKSTQFFNRIR